MLKLAVLLAAVIAFGALQVGARQATAALPLGFRIFPPYSTYGPPRVEGFTVYVGIENTPITDLDSFSFEVNFDDSVLSFSQATPGTFVTQHGAPICSPASITGQMQYSCVLTGGSVSGTGLLAACSLTYETVRRQILTATQLCWASARTGRCTSILFRRRYR
jgi:hypothetical protein